MEGERVVFAEESSASRHVKVVASGDMDETLLDALQDYVNRQRKRLGLPVAAKDDHAEEHARASLGNDRVPGMSR